MTGIKTTVAGSLDTKDAALNLIAKAYEVRRTLAAVWDTEPTQPPSPESAESLDMKNPGPGDEEDIIGEVDKRVLVDKSHFAPGGKYRSIVKLFMHYEFQKSGAWKMGTGWLIRPDVLVTAGHCSYDWGHKLGRATEVKAYIGYNGKDSTNESSVQFRSVKRIVTTEGWVKVKGQKSFDVSFMQVETPFTGITPVHFEETPSQGSLVLGVVGYPGDKKDKHGQPGAQMYEMFHQTEFNLATQADTMLEYRIDTYGGNSGAPVLRQRDMVSIGTHVYGGALNSASVIGKYGNPYEDYIAAFGLAMPDKALNLIPVTGSKAVPAPVPTGYGSSIPETPVTPQTQPRSQKQRRAPPMPKPVQSGRAAQGQNRIVKSQLTETEEEGFTEVLRTVASAFPIGLGFIGGGPIGALAGFALNAASRITAETMAGDSTMDTPDIDEGYMERAILAEATLSALQSRELPPDLEESIFSDMTDTVMKALPVIRKAAPHVMGAMMEPVLKIAIDSLLEYNQKIASGAGSIKATSSEPFRPTFLYTTDIDQPADHQAEAFLGHLQASLRQSSQESAMDGDSEEGFVDVIKAGARLVGKGVLAAAKHGLPILVDVLKQIYGAEAFEDQASSGPAVRLLAAEPLAQRALVADAALKAVMKISPQKLQAENFFDLVADAIKTIAPIAMTAAPAVAGAIHPTIGKIVSTVLKPESTSTGDSTIPGSTRPRLAATHGLSTKRSLYALRDGSASGKERRNRFGGQTTH